MKITGEPKTEGGSFVKIPQTILDNNWFLLKFNDGIDTGSTESGAIPLNLPMEIADGEYGGTKLQESIWLLKKNGEVNTNGAERLADLMEQTGTIDKFNTNKDIVALPDDACLFDDGIRDTVVTGVQMHFPDTVIWAKLKYEPDYKDDTKEWLRIDGLYTQTAAGGNDPNKDMPDKAKSDTQPAGGGKKQW